jgi:hypothetical protein
LTTPPLSAEQLFDAEIHDLTAQDGRVEAGKIFHSTGLKGAGKFFAFIRKGKLVVKLPEARVSMIVAEDEGTPFDAGKGRPMREWVVLGPADRHRFHALVGEALDFAIANGESDTDAK